MSFFSSVVGFVVKAAVTYFTGNPMLGQMAGDFASSMVDSSNNQSGKTRNSAFDNVFNQFLTQGASGG